ncbi:MAG: hypothetical protein RML40_02930 [Bacteroidota bacterium]|nr:hypothetical protein [Candidatus Kapabacteria bacterium]MDW8219464.1 hypothetical protein [Bacteroidota bacterium]
MLPALSLSTFIRAINDMERTRFEVLNGLKMIRSNFHHNKIYPDLSTLVELFEGLQSIMQNAESVRTKAHKSVKDIDIEERKVVYEETPIADHDFEQIRELITWALPLIQDAIEEGKTMFEFVDENLSMEVVGILPSYLEEGYIFVPDNTSSVLYLLKFEVSIFTGANEQYRSLKTSVIKTLRRTPIMQPIQSIKLDLVREFPEMPNPATYAFETDLEFPFYETILPVAKRRLLRHLYS